MDSVTREDVSQIYSEIIAEKYDTFKRVLEDFDIDFDVEEYLNNNFKTLKYCYESDFRTKCLIGENFKHLNYYLASPSFFVTSSKNLYAKERFYRETPSINEKYSFATVLMWGEKKFDAKFANDPDNPITFQDLLKKYPLTDETIKNMERIHRVKRNANGSGRGTK